MKNGKNLTKEEYNAMIQYGDYVKAFNVAIKSKYREEASLALAMDSLEKSDITVFTMGIGHRHNYKWLAPRYLKHKKTAFVLITAPELWWWKHMVGLFVKISLFVGVVAASYWTLTYL